MVAMVIMLIGLLGLLQSVNLATEHNLKNHLRDEAVAVGEDVMTGMKNQAFGTTFQPVTTVVGKLRGTTKPYWVYRTSKGVSTDSLQYTVRVVWSYKNISSSHEVISVKTR
jgi:type IV pilus assembly protein PilV